MLLRYCNGCASLPLARSEAYSLSIRSCVAFYLRLDLWSKLVCRVQVSLAGVGLFMRNFAVEGRSGHEMEYRLENLRTENGIKQLRRPPFRLTSRAVSVVIVRRRQSVVRRGRFCGTQSLQSIRHLSFFISFEYREPFASAFKHI